MSAWEEWVAFCLTGTVAQAKDTIDRNLHWRELTLLAFVWR